jgi:hypothetical protein
MEQQLLAEPDESFRENRPIEDPFLPIEGSFRRNR